jgi:hypothetical protein
MGMVIPYSGVIAIEQVITAASQFNGAAPGSTAVAANGVWTYPTSTTGGLFDFGQEKALEVLGVMITFGGQSSWTLKHVCANGGKYLIRSGLADTDLYITADTKWKLMPGDKLELITTGATTAMKARVLARREDTGDGN